MDKKNYNYELFIDEPWEESHGFEVVKIKTINSNSGKKCIYLENIDTNEGYLVSCRYSGEKLEDVNNGKMIIVGIYKILKGVKIDQLEDSINILDFFKYYGIGSFKRKVF